VIENLKRSPAAMVRLDLAVSTATSWVQLERLQARWPARGRHRVLRRGGTAEQSNQRGDEREAQPHETSEERGAK
jgi:hypothetical protein